jgi:hypothetical protein
MDTVLNAINFIVNQISSIITRVSAVALIYLADR